MCESKYVLHFNVVDKRHKAGSEQYHSLQRKVQEYYPKIHLAIITKFNCCEVYIYTKHSDKGKPQNEMHTQPTPKINTWLGDLYPQISCEQTTCCESY